MSLLATKALGDIELSTTEIYEFSEGLYGFPDEKEFAIVKEKEESPFMWLQSCRKADLAFVIIDPALFCKQKYVPELSSLDMEALCLETLDKCMFYVIVTIPAEKPEEMTANLQGPIVLHPEKKIGRQVISLDHRHEVRVSILSQLEV